jgi:diguanylate cyclase (GGDEF)-like protein
VVVGAALLTVALYLGPLRPILFLDVASPIPWWMLAVSLYLADKFLVHFEFRRDSLSFSLIEVPLVLGLFFTSPGGMALAQAANLAVSLSRRLPAVKQALNAATGMLGYGACLWVFHVLGRADGELTFTDWGAAFLATVTAAAIELSFIMLVMFVKDGALPEGWRRSVGLGLAVAATNTSLALTAVSLVIFDPRSVLLLVAPILLLFVAYRAYLWQRRKSQSLEALHDSTRTLHRSIDSEPSTHELLEQARSMFRSERAEFILFAIEDSDANVRMSMDADGTFRVSKAAVLDPRDGIWALVVARNEALFMPRNGKDETAAKGLQKLGVRDAMIAPLRNEQGVIGTLMVADRIGETFRRDDLPLFETLANHASVSLVNARLMERLREEAAEKEYRALHDPLTGLPNRSLFRDRLEQALRASMDDSTFVGVFLMDLDRFKEVNDALGHNNGDRVIVDVAERIRCGLHPDITVARFGGDEFGILVPRAGSLDETIRVATKLLECLEEPFEVDGIEIHLGGSIGVAVHPLHGDDPHRLIQRADVAMYAAKEKHSGYEIYSIDDDAYSPARLALAAELRRAIQGEDLLVYYQPKADLRTRKVVGVEALVRWQHPRRGFMSPDEFIPLAEHTGLVRPLTKVVLSAALEQCARWKSEGLDLQVSVNLSVRSLLDLNLPQEVGALLEHHRLEPHNLVLEITESGIMADPIRAAGVVQALHDLGVCLAIDDFGTGYSSLSYLKRLPVSEIKVDKSFVMAMLEDDNDAVIVRSTIDLGRNLGLRVVAEGIESHEAWQRLAALGCDVAQGYYLSRPLTAGEIPEWKSHWDASHTLEVL